MWLALAVLLTCVSGKVWFCLLRNAPNDRLSPTNQLLDTYSTVSCGASDPILFQALRPQKVPDGTSAVYAVFKKK